MTTLSPRLAQAVKSYAGENAARAQWIDGKIADIGAGKKGAVDEVAKALRVSPVEVVEIAAAALEGVAGNKGIAALLGGTEKKGFQAAQGGAGAGATLRAHGRFDDSSIIRETIIRKFGPNPGKTPVAILPLVGNLPPKAFDARGMLKGYADEHLPKTTDPPKTDAKSLWPYTDDWTRRMVVDALDRCVPEIEKRLKAFSPPIELQMTDLFERAARNVIDRLAAKGLDDDAEPRDLLKALVNGIPDEGARLLADVRFPRDPERQIDEDAIQKHCMASFIIGACEAFGVRARPGMGGVHDTLVKHGLEKRLPPGMFQV